MGNTFKTGNYVNAIFQDASNNIGIGAAPSGSYKLEVTGTAKVSSNLQLGTTTASSTTTPITLNMGGTYGTTLLNGIKIKMFDDGTTLHGLGVIAGNLYLNATDGATVITLNTNNTERMRITSAGNVGIGTSSPVTKLDVSGTIRSIAQTDPTSGTGLELFYRSADPACYVQSYDRTNSAYVDLKLAAGRILFYYANPSSVECARFSGLGYFKATNSGTYINTSGQYHEFSNSATNNEILTIRQTSASPYGMTMQFSAASPNNTTNWLIYCEDSTAQRFSVRSNGGVYNYTGNNVPLSDQRMKKEITPLESYWDKFKSIEMVKFKYIDQTHDDFNIGVVSQQIESIMPEFVDVWDEKNIPEDGKPLMGVYMEDIHNIAMKVLQEAMAKIEELNERLNKAGL